MVFAGILITIAGFVIALMSPGLAGGVWERFTLVLIGNAVSITGILGVLNRAYLRHAIWKR